MKVFRPASLALLAALIGGGPSSRAVERNPEIKSRALAWTEWDGSYLVDPGSRADMLDFFWTVFARPRPDVQWTGSLSPDVAGTTSELWRVREYAQLNAYRALNFSPPMAEDASKLSLVQEGALVLALNPKKPISHTIDSSWLGYNEVRSNAVFNSLLTGFSDFSAARIPMVGLVDHLMEDAGSNNAAQVGHRMFLMHDGNVKGATGAAYSPVWQDYSGLWNVPQVFKETPIGNFLSYPAPGFMPYGLFPHREQNIRWSFVPTTDQRQFDSMLNCTVTAKVNGKQVTPRNVVRNFNPSPVTWEFDPAEFDFGHETKDTSIEITVGNVNIGGAARTYRYTVNLFDENKITTVGFAPQSALKNLSTRGQIGGGDRVMISGFVVSGNTPVRVALRTQGPGLARFGIPNFAKGLKLQLFDQAGNKLGENAGWRQHQDWRLLQSLDLAPSQDDEPGMVATLWPGSYTAVVSSEGGTEGLGIVEAFNIDNLTTGRLINLSTRGNVGVNDQALIAGLIIANQARTVVVRTQGPALARFGVVNAVGDTMLKIIDQKDGSIVAENDDWQTDPRNGRLRTDLSAFAPTDGREAALVVTLPPGAYTAIVSAKNAAGVGLVEAFEVN